MQQGLAHPFRRKDWQTETRLFSALSASCCCRKRLRPRPRQRGTISPHRIRLQVGSRRRLQPIRKELTNRQNSPWRHQNRKVAIQFFSRTRGQCSQNLFRRRLLKFSLQLLIIVKYKYSKTIMRVATSICFITGHGKSLKIQELWLEGL